MVRRLTTDHPGRDEGKWLARCPLLCSEYFRVWLSSWGGYRPPRDLMVPICFGTVVCQLLYGLFPEP